MDKISSRNGRVAGLVNALRSLCSRVVVSRRFRFCSCVCDRRIAAYLGGNNRIDLNVRHRLVRAPTVGEPCRYSSRAEVWLPSIGKCPTIYQVVECSEGTTEADFVADKRVGGADEAPPVTSLFSLAKERRERAPANLLRRPYGRTTIITTPCEGTDAVYLPANVPISLCCHRSRTLALRCAG